MNLQTLASIWWEPTVVALAAVLLALIALRVIHPILLRLSSHSTLLHAVIAQIGHAMRWVLPLVALQLIWQGVPDTVPGIDGVRHVNGILLIAAVTAAAIAAVRGVADAVALLHPQDVRDNLEARRILTQTRVLSRIATGVILFAGLAFILMTFPRARQFGTSLLASAGLSALVIGIAARSVFGNLLAGLQIALSQPIRIDDVLIVENEWGRVEEITGTYVVLKIWDERRMVIPLQWFIEHPFQNWTRATSQLIGSVYFWVDYMTDLEPLRAEATRIAKGSKDYDGRVCLLQVVDTSATAMQLRLIASSPSAGQSWDLRCLLREGIIRYMRQHQPESLPRLRAELDGPAGRGAGLSRSAAPRPTAAPAPPPKEQEALPQADKALPPGSAHEMAEINDQTGMATLAAPTGGVPPAQENPR